MRRSVVGANPSTKRGKMRDNPSQMTKLSENAKKIATPPKRGRGVWWIWRPPCGVATQPLRLARSRTCRVTTNDTTSEKANNPKKRIVKLQFPSGWNDRQVTRLLPRGSFSHEQNSSLVALDDWLVVFSNYTTRGGPRATILAVLVVAQVVSLVVKAGVLRGFHRRRMLNSTHA
jgi:hypothetical protein